MMPRLGRLPPTAVGEACVGGDSGAGIGVTAGALAGVGQSGMSPLLNIPPGLRRTVAVVAGLNLAYFFVEFAVARRIGSVSLLADSIDFLEDASINLLIAVALGWSLRARSRIGLVLAAVLLMPGLATLWMAWQKFQMPVAPAALPLSLAGTGALAVNLLCAYLLARYRSGAGSLSKAAFLSARNDAFANVAIIAAAGVTTLTQSGWPDLVVGLAIAAMNADAAWEVWEAARREARDGPDEPGDSSTRARS